MSALAADQQYFSPSSDAVKRRALAPMST